MKTTESGGICGYDAGKRIKGRKRHIMTDTCGHLVATKVHAASIQDRDGAPAVFALLKREAPKLRHVFADGGYVKFTLAPQLRSERAEAARKRGLSGFEGEMRSFLESVLSPYEAHGVDELGLNKIGDFLKVRYGGTNGAKRALGEIPKIKQAFMDIQTHLYAP